MTHPPLSPTGADRLAHVTRSPLQLPLGSRPRAGPGGF